MDTRGLLDIAAEYSRIYHDQDTYEAFGADAQAQLAGLAAKWDAGLSAYVRAVVESR